MPGKHILTNVSFCLHALVLPLGHLVYTKAFIYYEGFVAQPEMEGNAT